MNGQELIPDRLKKRFFEGKSVVVVGNSSRLKGMGEVIDGHDIVVRLNAAPMIGYEKDVGSRLSYRFINDLLARGSHLLYSTTPKHYISTLRNEKVIVRPTSGPIRRRAEQLTHESVSLYRFSDRIETKYQTDWRRPLGKNPSTGFTAVFGLLELVSSLSVVGFDFYRGEPDEPVHYWDDFLFRDVKNPDTHQYEQEREWMMSDDRINWLE